MLEVGMKAPDFTLLVHCAKSNTCVRCDLSPVGRSHLEELVWEDVLSADLLVDQSRHRQPILNHAANEFVLSRTK